MSLGLWVFGSLGLGVSGSRGLGVSGSLGLNAVSVKLNRSLKSKVVYKASCWDCNDFYIGKTKRRLHDRKK